MRALLVTLLSELWEDCNWLGRIYFFAVAPLAVVAFIVVIGADVIGAFS